MPRLSSTLITITMSVTAAVTVAAAGANAVHITTVDTSTATTVTAETTNVGLLTGADARHMHNAATWLDATTTQVHRTRHHVISAHQSAVRQRAAERRAARLAKKQRAEQRAARIAAQQQTAGGYPGPGPWTGTPLQHPSGGPFPDSVLQWANTVTAVMADLSIDRDYLPGILAQMQQESSGDPLAVNDWDSNAAAGTPSQGLMQVIAPTYEAYARPGYEDAERYLTNPGLNIYAALNYATDRYGMAKFAEWNAGINPGY